MVNRKMKKHNEYLLDRLVREHLELSAKLEYDRGLDAEVDLVELVWNEENQVRLIREIYGYGESQAPSVA